MSSVPLVYIVDDDEAVRESLSVLLEVSGFAVQAFPAAEALLQVADSLRTGCVVTDVRMPGMDGIELMRRLKDNGVRLPVVVMTGHGDVPLAVQAMRVGAADFIEKPFDDEVLTNSVRSALAQASDAEDGHSLRLEIRERLSSLSMREAQVLKGLVAGLQNKTIARDLDISSRTVEIYRSHVMTKMQASSLSDLVRMALIAEMAR